LGKLKYNINWNETKAAWEMFRWWCTGETGYPVVDAAMTEMNTTGFMNHRGRLIVANFLCRLLQIDWMKGKHYMASRLIDYDQSINDCNWHWV
jgi:deoxyribodipyrimidine photo-lyase